MPFVSCFLRNLDVLIQKHYCWISKSNNPIFKPDTAPPTMAPTKWNWPTFRHVHSTNIELNFLLYSHCRGNCNSMRWDCGFYKFYHGSHYRLPPFQLKFMKLNRFWLIFIFLFRWVLIKTPSPEIGILCEFWADLTVQSKFEKCDQLQKEALICMVNRSNDD